MQITIGEELDEDTVSVSDSDIVPEAITDDVNDNEIL